MKDLLPFLVVGITSGSVYGLAGVGLVLTYKTSGVFNFAHGAVAAAAAYVFYDLHVLHRMAWPLAMVLCVGVLAPLLGLGFERIARHLGEISAVYTILATVGLMLAIQGGLTLRYGDKTLLMPPFLPTGSVRLSGIDIQYSQIITVIVGLVSAAGLYLFFARSRLGIAMRSVVDDPALLGLSGTSPTRVRCAAWIIGTSFAALCGILIAPSIGVDAIVLTLLVVQAFGATAVGGFSSLPLTYVGGIAIGVLTAFATKFVATRPSLGGLPSSIPFLVLFLSLLLFPGRLFRPPAPRRPRLRSIGGAGGRRLPGRLAVGAFVAGLCLLPQFVGARLPVYTTALVFVIIFVSLALLVWMSGQISLAHAAFAALGATTFSHLTHGAGVPWAVALLLAGLAVVPLGAVLALPAIRLSGVYLALATFGFGVLMERVVFPTGFMFGFAGRREAPRPVVGLVDLATDRHFFYVVLVVAVAACLLVVAVSSSRLGRLLRALADSPTALTVHGLNTNATRIIVFCLSAFLAGIAGALYSAQLGIVSGRGFGVLESLMWLTVLVFSGTAAIRSALVAATVLVVVPAYAPQGFIDHQILIFGALALVATLATGRSGLNLRRTGEKPAMVKRPSPVRARFEEAASVPRAAGAST